MVINTDKPLKNSFDSDTETTVSSSSVEQPKRERIRRRRRQNKKNRNVSSLSPTEQAQYIAMDCEMVGVGPDGLYSQLARVILIDWNSNVLLDVFVKPHQPVTDYRTFVSGITPADFEHAIDIDTCRQKVQALLQDKILVGHALKNDLQALGIRHPWFLTRDTAKYEPFQKVRFDDGVLWPRKLKELVQQYLNRDIQLPGRPHCPVEDAKAALDLYKTVRMKFEKVMDYKIQKTEAILAQNQRLSQQHANTVVAQ